jgi:cytochrome c-type biogenesis protein CcmF
MTRILGSSAASIALLVALYGMVAAFVGGRRRSARLAESARMAAFATFALMTVANLAMIQGLVSHDFSIGYVAQVGSRSTPLLFTVISLWSALEGSILFWGWVLSGYTAAAVWFQGRRLGSLGVYANGVLLGIGAFFYLLLIGPADPFFEVFPVPPDGPGPNPLLQNHILMAVHPPLLYLGYVGMSVPFAFAMGALLAGRLDDAWLRVTRRWTMVSWMFLSLAIVMGMWWSYEVLGWGGYWAWDPVENASFMPWLTATAFLHSSMVQERRDTLRVWNQSLIISTFLLTILGTFLTRSGVLSSVHAFTEGTIGYFFLTFIAIVLIASLVLLTGRSAELRKAGTLDNPLSRETVFLVNNLLFTAFTFTVLLGTLFPLVAEAIRGVKVSVGAPFFNRMTVPICVALLFLVGIGPVLPWRGGKVEQMRRQLVAPSLALLAVAVLALVLRVPSAWAVVAFAFGAFSLVSNIQEFVRGAAARRNAHGENPAQALFRLVASNNRRYGGYLAHIGLVLLAVGITASSAYRTEREATLKPGESAVVGRYRLQLEEVRADQEPHRWVVRAVLNAYVGDRPIGSLDPRLNYYNERQEPITTPAVRSTPRDDLYANLLAWGPDGSNATISVIVEPLVFWIWFGGIVVALGGLLSAWPRRRARAPVRLAPAQAVEV